MTINACFARMVAHTIYIYNIFLWIYQIKIFAVMHSQKWRIKQTGHSHATLAI